MLKIDENTVQMDIVYTSGETATLTGIKDGQNVSYYMDGQLVSQTTIAELEKIQGTDV
jgi:Cu/Ag efflux protein CusF